jgi:hypothetical protein
LEHKLDLVGFEQRWEKRELCPGLAAGKTAPSDDASDSSGFDVGYLDVVHPTGIVEHRDVRAGPQPEYAIDLM